MAIASFFAFLRGHDAYSCVADLRRLVHDFPKLIGLPYVIALELPAAPTSSLRAILIPPPEKGFFHRLLVDEVLILKHLQRLFHTATRGRVAFL